MYKKDKITPTILLYPNCDIELLQQYYPEKWSQRPLYLKLYEKLHGPVPMHMEQIQLAVLASKAGSY